MATRTVSLVSFRRIPNQRAHFAIFIPSAADPQKGTLIHVVGAPMVGYSLEFKRNYAPATTQQPHTMTPIGHVSAQHVIDSSNAQESVDSTPRCNVETVAARVAPPRISQNFMAPVNDVSCIYASFVPNMVGAVSNNQPQTTNKRCQEWTMEYVRELVGVGYIGPEAIQAVNSRRDPPNHGIGLQPAGRGRGLGA